MRGSPHPIPFGWVRSSWIASLLGALCLSLGLGLGEDLPGSSNGYRIERYEIVGATGVDPAATAAVLAGATGTNVSLPQIRAGMVRLQQWFRDQGLTHATVTLPRQSLTRGVVVLRVDGPGLSAAPPKRDATNEGVGPKDLPAWKASAFDIRHFVIRGNTVLSPEEIDRALSPAAGPSTGLTQLEAALKRLQSLYRERGYSGSVALLPQQLVTDGTVSIVVREGPAPVVKTRETPLTVDPAPVPTPAPKPAGFEVRRYAVAGNSLLTPEVLDNCFTNAVGTNVTFPQIQTALGQLQLAYRERGFATVSVGLPQQQITNGVVRVQVTEGLLTDIRVTGNRHFSSNNVMRSLPSLRTNILLNSRVFQRELDTANQNRDRQIYPNLGPGPDPGTTALDLRVKDRLPLHGRFDIDNYSTPGTPPWRINTSVQYNNLWQREHQVGVSYGFSPQQYKDPGPSPDLLLNRPLVSYFSGYYRMPVGSPDSVEEQIRSSQTFGYNEATRQFVLPPLSSSPEVIVFGSAAPIDTGVQYGPERIISQTPLLTIVSQDTGQNLTWADDVGGQYNHPWVLSDAARVGGSVGLDWKRFIQQSFNTNNFIITTVVTNAQGSQTIVTRVASPQPTRMNAVTYLPFNLGGNFARTDRTGSWSGNAGFAFNPIGDTEQFRILSGSRRAQAQFGKGTVGFVREQKLPSDWSLLLRGSGQGATGPLIGNEQFSLGGVNSVRGYLAGDVFGDSGWFTSAELRTPFLATTVPIWKGDVPAWVRGSVFIDSGQGFLLNRGEADRTYSRLLWGAGFGLSLSINQAVNTRFALGWPFESTLNTEAYVPTAYFTLEGQF